MAMMGWCNHPPATFNSQPSTLNPHHSTLIPQPSTLSPQPSTLNPQPSTLNPQPSTLNHAEPIGAVGVRAGCRAAPLQPRAALYGGQTIRIPSGVASSISTSHEAHGCMFVELRNAGNLGNWRSTAAASRSAPWRSGHFPPRA